jgi:hypothetical protein
MYYENHLDRIMYIAIDGRGEHANVTLEATAHAVLAIVVRTEE